MKRMDWSQLGPRLAWLALVSVGLIVLVVAAVGFAASRALDDRVAVVVEQLNPASSADDKTAEPSEGSDNGFNHGQMGGGGRGGFGHPGGGASPGDSDSPAAAAVSRIQKRFLFMPAPPQGFRNVQGVLGDRVLYPGGQSFGLGENAMGATVVALGSNWVELKHEDETIVLDISYGGERGPELMRWDGQPPNANKNQGQPRMGQGERRRGGSSQAERRRGSRQKAERGERRNRGDRSRRPQPNSEPPPAEGSAAPENADDADAMGVEDSGDKPSPAP